MSASLLMYGQVAVRYDYRWVEVTETGNVWVASPDSASRWIKVDQDIRKDMDPSLRMAMRLVQEYESQGWELFNVEMAKEKFFFLRKQQDR
jgi:hypothetical protein